MLDHKEKITRRKTGGRIRDATIVQVKMPIVSYGACTFRNCTIVGELGDGLCLSHWDFTNDRKYKEMKRKSNERTNRKRATKVCLVT